MIFLKFLYLFEISEKIYCQQFSFSDGDDNRILYPPELITVMRAETIIFR